MNSCVRTLFNGIIDYAGLFPPAQLSMDDALARYINHRSTSDGWMLGRFVCPAARFTELEALLAAMQEQFVPAGSVVIQEGDTNGDLYLVADGEFSGTIHRIDVAVSMPIPVGSPERRPLSRNGVS